MSTNISSGNTLSQLLGYLQQQSKNDTALNNATRLQTTQQEVVFLSNLPAAAAPTSSNNDLISQAQSRFNLLQTTLSQIQQFKQNLTTSNKALDKLASSSKDAARQQLALLKQRIEAMKKLLAFADPQTAKNLLRQIKQMAGELKAAAQTLSENSSSGGNSGSSALSNLATGTSDTSSTDTANTSASASASASTTSTTSIGQTIVNTMNATTSKQSSNADDIKLIRDVALQLKALNNALKNLAKRTANGKQQSADTDKLLNETSKILQSMSNTANTTSLGNLTITLNSGQSS